MVVYQENDSFKNWKPVSLALFYNFRSVLKNIFALIQTLKLCQ